VVLVLVFTFGVLGLVPWCGWMGVPILLAAYLILAVFAAVRYARGSSVSDIDEFEREMMTRYRERRRSRRHHRRPARAR
jgi:hypothetical protein